MTEVAKRSPAMLVNPMSGEILEATPGNAATVLEAVRQQRSRLLELAKLCEDILIAESETRGSKTYRVAGYKTEVREKHEDLWLTDVLEELLEAGLPEERYNELVIQEVSYKVSGLEAKRIAAANPEYADIIERARQRVHKTPYVKVAKA